MGLRLTLPEVELVLGLGEKHLFSVDDAAMLGFGKLDKRCFFGLGDRLENCGVWQDLIWSDRTIGGKHAA